MLTIRQFYLNELACAFASQGTSEPWVRCFAQKGMTTLFHLFSRFKLVLLAPALLLTLSAMGFIAPQAHAASVGHLSKTQVAAPLTNTANCSSLGSLIEYDPIYANGTQIGELQVYYNSSTGYNCAYLHTGGPAYGQAQYIDVWIGTCKETAGDQCTSIQHDEDGSYNYRYYAGPVGVYGSGHCIAAVGRLEWQNNWYRVATNPFVGHCG